MKKASTIMALFTSLFGFSFEKIAPNAAYDMVTHGSALLFDVREAEELQAEGKAAMAEFFPKSSIDAQDASYKAKLATLPKDKTLIFYCRSGKRAGIVADHFTKLGFTTKNMGAFSDWVATGLPVSNVENYE